MKRFLFLLVTLLSGLGIGSAWADNTSKTEVVTFGAISSGDYTYVTDKFTVNNEGTKTMTTTGNSNTITITPSVGNMWGTHSNGDGDLSGTWSNATALTAMNTELGTNFTATDFGSGNPIAYTASGNGGSTSTLTLHLANGTTGNPIVIYASVTARGSVLSNLSVTGIDDAAITYAAAGSDNGFVSTQTFSSGSTEATIVRISGKQTSSDIVLSSTTGKNGWHMLAYTYSMTVEKDKVTYNYYMDDELVYTEKHTVKIGETFPAVQSTPWKLTLKSNPVPTTARTADDDNTYDIMYETTEGYPFTFVSSTSAAKYQTLMNNPADTKKYWVYSSTDATANVTITSTSGTDDTYQWMFVGNPFEGYTIYNKSAGTTVAATWDSGYIKLTAAGLTTKWTPSASVQTTANYFCLKTSGNNNYPNTQGNYLKGWSSNDGGSTTLSSDPYVRVIYPDMSTVAEPKWYKIKFTAGSTCLESQGDGAFHQTAARNDKNMAQFFCFIGTKDNCKIYSRDGYYIGVKSGTATNNQTANLCYSTTEANATSFCIQQSTTTSGNFVISQTTDKTTGMNTWGGSGAGVNVGFYNISDTNDQLTFISEADIPITEYFKVNSGSRPTDISKYSLWYDVPAAYTGVSDTWMEYALPLGNGQLGATFRGNVWKDELQLNEKTVWSGNTANSGQGYFQNLGSIVVTDLSGAFSLKDDTKPVNDYQRYLDIINGVGGVNYKSSDNATQYKRRYFTSATDHVFVARYEADGTDKLSLNFAFSPDATIGSTVTYTSTGASYGKKLETITYNTAFEVVADEGATVEKTDDGIKVTGATWAEVIQAAATDYDATKSGCVSGKTADEIAAVVSSRISAAKTKGYETLLSEHVAAFSALMNRVDLDLGGSSDLTTEELIKFYNAADQNKTSDDGKFLETLYFQYGRYMTIGANNDQTIHAPSNLQGIWNDRSNTSFWHCDIHADINVEMNYWPADPTNLSEMHLPFVNHIIDLAGATNSPWHTLATNRGATSAGTWTVACENNIFGGSSTWCNGSMKTLGSWYVTHLWRYYRYTMDKEFLQKALPIMYANALYTKEIASDDTESTSPGGETTLSKVILGEWSPEHGDGGPNAFAQQTASEAIYNTISAYNELKDADMLSGCSVTEDQITALQSFFDTFDKGIHIENYTWTRDGTTYTDQPCISEWLHIALTDPGHRHLSHLMCVYPFGRISAYDNTERGQALFEAANNGILARNGDVTGWSMGWQTNVYARCLKGDNARGYLSKALKHSTSYVIAMGGQGGCYYNLFDAHSPFQIDGNYGCTSGVAEMLLQSYDGITLLPALPTAWAKGSVKGLKAEGNFTVDETWNYEGDVKVLRATITSNAGSELRLRTLINGATVSLKDDSGKIVVPDADGVYVIPATTKGKTYTANIVNQSIADLTKKIKSAVDSKSTSTTEINDIVDHLLLR